MEEKNEQKKAYSKLKNIYPKCQLRWKRGSTMLKSVRLKHKNVNEILQRKTVTFLYCVCIPLCTSSSSSVFLQSLYSSMPLFFLLAIYMSSNRLKRNKIYLHWLHYISLSIYNISSLTLQLKLSDLMNIFKCVQLFQWWTKVK